MPRDRQLSANFRLSEWPCWELATESQVLELQETVARVLQPIRSRFGPVWPTSWMHWSSGCVPRSGAHAQGGTVDFQVADGRTREAWEWGAQHLVPAGYIGRWIYEPERRDHQGRKVQGEHIHVAPREDMLALNGDGRIQVLEETAEGQYRLWFDGDPELGPIEIPGLTVTVPRPFPAWLALFLAGLGWGLLVRHYTQEA